MSSTPDVSAELKLFPLNSIMVEVWANGLLQVIGFLTVWAILRKGVWSLQNGVLLGVMALVIMTATIHMALAWWFLINAFSNFGGTPGIINALAHTSEWYKAFGGAIFTLNVLIADLVFIWRCYVVWNKRIIVTIIPLMMTISGLALSIVSVVGQVEVTRTKLPGQVPQKFVTFSTPYFGLSLATSLYATILITVKMALVRREFVQQNVAKGLIGVPGSTISQWRLLMIEIPAEAAVIYSVNLIAWIVLLARKNEKLVYPQDLHPQITGIAVSFIVYRVVMGYSRRVLTTGTDSERRLKVESSAASDAQSL